MRPASQKRLASLVALAVAAALGACSSDFKTSEDGSQSSSGGAGPSGDAGAAGDSGGTGTSTGGTGSGGRASGGAETGDSGGARTGGSSSGGTDTGGSSSGGTDTGGSNSGGTDTGGSNSGGTDTGGSSTGGGGNETKTGLVINEVDYDNIGTDTAEFIEIYNASSADISLAGVTLYLINGAGTTTAPYATVDLSPQSVLKAHGYLIYAPYTLPLAASGEALRIDATPTSNAIQNGSPDGIVLARNDTVLDVLSYEGAIEAAAIPELGTVSLVEKTALSDLVADGGVTDGSLCRGGADTNDSSVDWKFCGKPTPGAANVVDP
jgi:hypothetical protein